MLFAGDQLIKENNYFVCLFDRNLICLTKGKLNQLRECAVGFIVFTPTTDLSQEPSPRALNPIMLVLTSVQLNLKNSCFLNASDVILNGKTKHGRPPGFGKLRNNCSNMTARFGIA